MEEHSKATQQLAATLTDEIARAKAGEEQSAETAEELRRRVADDQAAMEAEKTLVRQQVCTHDVPLPYTDEVMPRVLQWSQVSAKYCGGVEPESLDRMRCVPSERWDIVQVFSGQPSSVWCDHVLRNID